MYVTWMFSYVACRHFAQYTSQLLQKKSNKEEPNREKSMWKTKDGDISVS